MAQSSLTWGSFLPNLGLNLSRFVTKSGPTWAQSGTTTIWQTDRQTDRELNPAQLRAQSGPIRRSSWSNSGLNLAHLVAQSGLTWVSFLPNLLPIRAAAKNPMGVVFKLFLTLFHNFIHPFIHSPIHPSIHPSFHSFLMLVCLSVCLSVCLPICLPIGPSLQVKTNGSRF